MKQSDLQVMHNFTMTKIQLYASGLITLLELQEAIKSLKIGDMKGLTDPATGLQFP